MYFGKNKNAKIIHIIDNNITKCNKTNITERVSYTNSNYNLCKTCQKKCNIAKINIFDSSSYIKINNIIYTNEELDTVYGIIKNDGNISFKDINTEINLISINKIKYYLVNNSELYSYDNKNVLNNIFENKLGKLLGPQIALINKNMVIIDKLKYNLWKIF